MINKKIIGIKFFPLIFFLSKNLNEIIFQTLLTELAAIGIFLLLSYFFFCKKYDYPKHIYITYLYKL